MELLFIIMSKYKIYTITQSIIKKLYYIQYNWSSIFIN